MPYHAYSVTVNTGTITSGTVNTTRASDDSRLAVREVIGTPGFDVVFLFKAVPDEQTSLHIEGYYDGNVAHVVKLYIWRYSTSSWVAVTANEKDIAAGTVDVLYSFNLPNPLTNYLSSGDMQIQVYHSSPGNVTHYMYFDHVYLQAGPM